jgi:hypothetical protein
MKRPVDETAGYAVGEGGLHGWNACIGITFAKRFRRIRPIKRFGFGGRTPSKTSDSRVTHLPFSAARTA